MTRKSNAQISNFMDKHFLFKIYNDKYNLNYDYSEMTFSDLEAIIQSNYKYWEKKNKDNKMTTPIFNSWINWNAKFEQLKNFLKNKEEFDYQEVNNYIYNNFSSSFSSKNSAGIDTYLISISSPINKDKDIASIRIFIDFYLNSWATDHLLEAIENYIEIEKDKNQIGYYFSSSYSYKILPALFVLNRETPNHKIPFKEIQNKFIEPVSESVNNIAKETEEHFKQTTRLIDENDEKIREIFIEHSREVDKFKHNLE